MSRARWIEVVVALVVLFGAGFLLLGDNPVLSGATARQWLVGHGRWAAAISVALLAGDVVLPVPSSVVMTANGRLFGVAGGAAVSFVGSMSAWLGCYWLGRLLGWGVGRADGRGDAETRRRGEDGRGDAGTPGRREDECRHYPRVPPFSRNAEGVRASPDAPPDVATGAPASAPPAPPPAPAPPPDPVARNLRRFGVLLLIATRPVPILAELLAATAGLARMGWWRFLLGAALGTAPICLLYAWVGARSENLADSFVALAIAVAVPLLLYAAIARPWLRGGRGG